MRFRLTYKGPLASNGRPEQKQKIRRALHPQIKELWRHPPLAGNPELLADQAPEGFVSFISHIGAFRFAPVVSSKLFLTARLDLTLLRREDPGRLVQGGGDIDNRIKTLLDALRVPTLDELKGDAPGSDEDPFHCLLEDDGLATELSITTDRLLEPGDPREVQLLMLVTVAATRVTWGGTPFIV